MLAATWACDVNEAFSRRQRTINVRAVRLLAIVHECGPRAIMDVWPARFEERAPWTTTSR